MKEQKISAIREGTVIDHIPKQNAFKVAEILNVKESSHIVSVATNLKSKKIGEKGIVKIGGRTLTAEELNKIALLAPHGTVTEIKNFDIIKKFKLSLPKEAVHIIQCSNPKCISNLEKINTRFFILTEKPLTVRCNYCERIMKGEEIKII